MDVVLFDGLLPVSWSVGVWSASCLAVLWFVVLKCWARGAMIPLSWNCRGLGNPRSVRALLVMVQRWKLDIVSLMETKSKVKRMERIKNRIKFANGLIVPSQDRSGGVALFWTREINLEIKSFSGNHIDAIVREVDNSYNVENHWLLWPPGNSQKVRILAPSLLFT